MNLVIGFGNPLRGDDGAGPSVAEAVHRRRDDVQVLTPQQLLPEHAEVIARAHVVVFVDAADGPTPGAVDCRALRAAPDLVPDHAMTPQGILALAHSAYGADPEAWLVTVQGARFDVHRGLSHAVAAAVPLAARYIDSLLTPRRID